MYENNILICDMLYVYENNADANINHLVDYAKQHNKQIIYV